MKRHDAYTRDLLIAGFVLCVFLRFRESMIGSLDHLFATLTGKSLLGRNLPVRLIVFGGAAVLALALIVGLVRLIRRHKTLGAVLVWLVIIGGFVLLARLCAVQGLRRDDLWEVREAQKYGFFGVQKYDFLTYNGRYFGWFLKAFYAVLDPVPYIDIMLLVGFLLTFGGLSDFIHTLLIKFGADAARTAAAAIAFAGLAAFIMLSSNVWEVWFWASAEFIYGYGAALTLWTAALTARVLAYPERRQPGVKALALLCVICGCGCSELVTASLGIFLFALFVILWVRNRRPHPFVTLLFATACVCVLIILLCSGTVGLAMKRGHYDPSADHGLMSFVGRLPGAFAYIAHALWGFTLIRGQYLALFTALCFVCGFGIRLSPGQRNAMLGGILILLAAAHLSMLVNTIANFMPPRVIGVPICWVTLAFGAAGFLLGGLIPHGRADASLALVCALCGLLCIGGFYHENFETQRLLREAWSQRDAELRALSGTEGVITTCSLPVPGSSVLDILPDENEDYNKNIAQYYGFDGIRADGKCEAFR